MFNIKINCESSDKKMFDSLREDLFLSVENVMKYAQELALKKKRGTKSEKLIPYEIKEGGNKIKARLYTDFDYALFLEYGTGTRAELDHIGHTKTFKESGYRYWFLPKAVADSRGAEFSPERLININGEFFYIMFPTEPQPFMRPTAAELEENIVRKIIEGMKKNG